jgi:hypothetical protein
VSDVLGLPLHPLVVHAAVVLVPLVALGMVLAAASPTWADRLRVPLGVLSVAGAGAAVVARWSGQQLLARVPGSAELAEHVDVADLLAWFVVAFAVLVVAWAALSARGTAPRWLGWLAAVAGLAVTVWTVLAGHTGATSVWGDVL